MRIDEAIEILEDFRKQESDLLGNEFKEAILLGIEALRGIVLVRQYQPELSNFPLQGETGRTEIILREGLLK